MQMLVPAASNQAGSFILFDLINDYYSALRSGPMDTNYTGYTGPRARQAEPFIDRPVHRYGCNRLAIGHLVTYDRLNHNNYPTLNQMTP
jgi:hypothetical protein